MCCQKRGSSCNCNVAAVIVRSFHTLIVLGVPASLLLKDSMLRRWLWDCENVPVGLLYILLIVWSLAMYFTTCFTDPGYISLTQGQHKQGKLVKSSVVSEDEDEGDTTQKTGDKDDADHNDNNNTDDEDGHMMPHTNKSGIKYRVCDFCEIQQPMRAKHCEDCNKCVRKFDHHCPWLEACVGERNHRFFWLFLLSTLLLIFVTFIITWNAFHLRLTWTDWLKTNGVLLFDLVVLFIGGMVVMGLLAFHSFLMLKGLTTWEAASRERITYLKYLDEDYNPFNEGTWTNLSTFLCLCRMRRWEKVYAKQARGINGIV